MSYDWMMVTMVITPQITAHVGYQGNPRDFASLKLVECQPNESNLLEIFLVMLVKRKLHENSVKKL